MKEKIIRHICDRCGHVFTDRYRSAALRFSFKVYWSLRKNDIKYKYDLCEKCNDSFTAWLRCKDERQ